MAGIQKIDSKNYSTLVENIGSLLSEARGQVATTANTILVRTYWQIGRYIVEYEQQGNERAENGSNLLHNLSRDLTLLYGKGFSHSNINKMRKMFLSFPILQTVSAKLSWSHYVEILKSDDAMEISFYTKECEKCNWSVRELKRQMESMLFHRLALSTNKDSLVMQYAMQGISNNLFAARYQLYMPRREELERELQRVLSQE